MTPEDLDVLTRAAQGGHFGLPPTEDAFTEERIAALLGKDLPEGWELTIRGDLVVFARSPDLSRRVLPNLALDIGTKTTDNGT